MTRINDSTRVKIFVDSDSTWVTLRKMVSRLESIFYRMTQLESQSRTLNSSQSHFYKISEFLMDKSSSIAHKEMSIFASVMIKIVANFLFWLSGRAMLHFKDQVSLTCTEADLRLCFNWRVSRAQYVDTLSRFNVAFAYRDHAIGLILWLWIFCRYQQSISSFSDSNSVQKLIANYGANTKTEFSFNPNFCQCFRQSACGDVIAPHTTLNTQQQ